MLLLNIHPSMPSTMVIPIPVDRWDSEAVIEDDESSHRRQFGTSHNAAWQPVWHSICSEQNLVGVINILVYRLDLSSILGQ